MSQLETIPTQPPPPTHTEISMRMQVRGQLVESTPSFHRDKLRRLSSHCQVCMASPLPPSSSQQERQSGQSLCYYSFKYLRRYRSSPRLHFTELDGSKLTSFSCPCLYSVTL